MLSVLKKISVLKTYRFYLWLILMMQVAVLIYWGSQKSNYYWDEFFTFDNAHYYASTTPERVKLDNSDLFQEDTWMPVKDLKATYLVTKESSVLNDSFLHNVKRFFSYKPYMLLLNVNETIFFEGKMSKWGGISLNIIFFLVSQVFLYILVNKLIQNEKAALLSVIMYGFCGMAISMVEFVRMYVFISFLIIIVTYFHYEMWESQIWWKDILLEVFSVIVIYLAYLNSLLVALYAAGLIFCFSAGLLIQKRYKQLLIYFVPITCSAVAYLWFKTNFIRELLQPQKYLKGLPTDSVEYNGLQQMLNFSLEELKMRIKSLYDIFVRLLFGNNVILWGWIALIIVLLIIYANKRKNGDLTKIQWDHQKSFSAIMFGTVILFMVLMIYTGAGLSRYYSLIFPEVSALCVIVAWDLGRIIGKSKLIEKLVSFLIIFSAIITFCIPQIENLYLDDKDTITILQEYKVDSVLINCNVLANINDCIAWVDEDSRIYVYRGEYLQCEGFPDEFMLWVGNKQEIDDQTKSILQESGYTLISKLGGTYLSDIYLCER